MNNKIPEFKTLKPLINSLIFKYYKGMNKVWTNDDLFQELYLVYNNCLRTYNKKLGKDFTRYFVFSVIYHIKHRQYKELREKIYMDKNGSFNISINDLTKARHNTRLVNQIKNIDDYENQLRHNFKGITSENLEEQIYYRLFWEIELPKYMKKKELKLLGERYGYDIKNGEPSKRQYSRQELIKKYKTNYETLNKRLVKVRKLFRYAYDDYFEKPLTFN